MKVAIIVDQLIDRDHTTNILEAVLGLFNDDQVDLYTLAHHPGKILGMTEQRRIFSSFLSKFINNKLQFNNSVLRKIIAAKSLKVNDQYDLSITICDGFSSLVSQNKIKKKILLKIGHSESKLLDYFQKKNKTKFDLVLDLVTGKDFDKVSPFHQVEKIPLANEKLETVTVFIDSDTHVEEIRKNILKNNLKINWVGITGINNQKEYFFKNLCINDLSKLLNNSLFCIDHGKPSEPNYLLSLMAGRPVINFNKVPKQVPFEDDSLYFSDLGNLASTIDQVIMEIKHHDPGSMRRKAGVYNARRFKKELFETIQKSLN